MPVQLELADFLESGVAMLGASADVDNVPEVFRVWGAAYDDASGTVRALVSSDAGRTLDGVHQGQRICFTFTDIIDFTSVQAKGSLTGPAVPPGPDDAALARRYTDRFRHKLAEIGHPGVLCDTMRPTAVFVLVAAIDEFFDQTPGPRAGARVDVA